MKSEWSKIKKKFLPVTDEPSFVAPKIVMQIWNSSAVTSC